MAKINQLQKLGLNKNEAKTYLALIQIGPASLIDLAHETSIPRTTLYYSIQGLKEKGLAYEAPKNKKRYLRARRPDFLKRIAAKEIEKAGQAEKAAESLIPSLKKMASAPASHSQVKFYEGKESVWEVFEIILRSNQNSYWFGFGRGFFKFFDYRSFVNNFSKKRRQFGRTKTLNILPSIPEVIGIARREDTFFHEFKFLKEKSGFKAGICVFGDKIAIFSYDKNISATIITGKAVSEIARTMFLMIWDSLNPTIPEKTPAPNKKVSD